MNLQEELLIRKPLDVGQEMALSMLLTREYVARFLDECLFKPEGITDQQYNVLRILKGGPADGYLIREIRDRMIARSADVPRLVDRLVAQGLVQRKEDDLDRRGSRVRLTVKGEALEARLAEPNRLLSSRIEGFLTAEERSTLLDLLERLRDGIRMALQEEKAG
jgi:DNA-binding MarR family transcriptional regulator